MKHGLYPVAVSLLAAALAIPAHVTAQEKAQQHTRYRFIDLGTLGGPNSGVPTVFYEINGTAGAQNISSRGTVTGTADTSNPDPQCSFDDCFFPNTFQWQNGTLSNLGALPGSPWSNASWISNNGLIAGLSQNGENDPITGTPEARAVLWQGDQISDLGTLDGGYESIATAVNSQGQVVGLTSNGTSDPYSYVYFQILGISTGTQGRAFIWDVHNGMHDLGTLGGPDAWAGQVNERGQVAGISYTSFTANADNATCAPNAPAQDPFFWEKDTGMIDIGTFGGTCGVTNAINNRGQVVGQSYLTGNTVAHAFLWDKKAHSQLEDLGTLGGDNASALWIDDAGEVVGYADLPPNPPDCSGLTCVHHAFLWKHGVMTDLGSIGTDPCSRALSVNSRGQIVGFSAAVCGGNPTHGFLWEDSGPAIDLNFLVSNAGMTLTTPVFINDRGEIAGMGVLSNGDTHAFVLIPCDDNHPNIEGCDYSLTDAIASPDSAVSSGPMNNASPTPGSSIWSKHLLGSTPHVLAGMHRAGMVSEPAIEAAVAVPLAITSGQPPGGHVGRLYDVRCFEITHCLPILAGFSVTAAGGVQPYSWSWTGQPGSSLPPGLMFGGGFQCVDVHLPAICGKPTTAGLYNVLVTVKDSASPPNRASARYTIPIFAQ